MKMIKYKIELKNMIIKRGKKPTMMRKTSLKVTQNMQKDNHVETTSKHDDRKVKIYLKRCKHNHRDTKGRGKNRENPELNK